MERFVTHGQNRPGPAAGLGLLAAGLAGGIGMGGSIEALVHSINMNRSHDIISTPDIASEYCNVRSSPPRNTLQQLRRWASSVDTSDSDLTIIHKRCSLNHLDGPSAGQDSVTIPTGIARGKSLVHSVTP